MQERQWFVRALAVTVVVGAAGCASTSGSVAPASTAVDSSAAGTVATVPATDVPDADLLVIDGHGIGDIHLGDSLQSLVDKGLLSPDLQDACTYIGPGVRWQTDMLLPAGMSGIADIDKEHGDVVSIIDVYGTGWRTAEGALPGMSLADLSDLYPGAQFEQYLGTDLLHAESEGGPIDLVLDGTDHLVDVAVPGLWYCD